MTSALQNTQVLDAKDVPMDIMEIHHYLVGPVLHVTAMVTLTLWSLPTVMQSLENV